MRESSSQGRALFLVAGEPSGDHLGAALMARLRKLRPGLRFIGVGGPQMAVQGLDSLFPMDDLAVMGIAEILPRIPMILRRLRQTADGVARQKPLAVITIDSPDFAMRLAARLAGRAETRDIPRIHYVAPSVWAWRPGRAARMAQLFDYVLTLLPFEPSFFKAVGLDAAFVGHPAVEKTLAAGAGADFRACLGLPPDGPLLCVLPGSRKGEIVRLGPIFYHTIQSLGRRIPRLRVVVVCLESQVGLVEGIFGGCVPPVCIVTGAAAKWGAFAASTAALAASGTVLVELAVAGTPGVVAYRLNPVSGFLARRLIRVRHVSLINLVAQKTIQPEYLQADCTSKRLAAACLSLLRDPLKAAQQTRQAREVLTLLGAGAAQTPSQRAGRAILDHLESLGCL